jgi:hypothetical protein
MKAFIEIVEFQKDLVWLDNALGVLELNFDGCEWLVDEFEEGWAITGPGDVGDDEDCFAGGLFEFDALDVLGIHAEDAHLLFEEILFMFVVFEFEDETGFVEFDLFLFLWFLQYFGNNVFFLLFIIQNILYSYLW